jgi:hypothetical protein
MQAAQKAVEYRGDELQEQETLEAKSTNESQALAQRPVAKDSSQEHFEGEDLPEQTESEAFKILLDNQQLINQSLPIIQGSEDEEENEHAAKEEPVVNTHSSSLNSSTLVDTENDFEVIDPSYDQAEDQPE